MLNIDVIIFSVFLSINLIIGLLSSKGVTNIRQYAIGDRNFSTSTLTSTIVATWLGVEFLTFDLTETYRQGFYFMIPATGDAISLLLVSTVFAKRMGEFLGKLSIAQAMGDLFGRNVKFITAMMGVFLSIGYLAIQFKVSAKILEMIFGSLGIYSTLLSAAIVIVYSTLGGIRSVASTDVIQLCTFCLIIPVIGIVVWYNSDGSIMHTLNTNENFDLKLIFNLKNPKFYEMLVLGIFFFIPCFQPAMFQRISMASSTEQITKSFKLSSIICLMMQAVLVVISILVLSENPNLDPDNLIHYIVDNYTYTFFKGLFAIAIMAVIMSTADSLTNTIAVITANDLLKPSGFELFSNELKTTKVFAITAAIIAVLLALKFQSVLDLILVCAGAYMAIVSMPFILAIFGFRSSEKSVLIGMLAAGSTFFIWKTDLLGLESTLDASGPAMLANITFLFSSHYLLAQPGGWVGIKDKHTFENHKKAQRKKRQEFVSSVLNFSFIRFCQNNLPANENIYHLTGFISAGLAMINIFSSSSHQAHSDILVLIAALSWIVSAYFAIFPIMPTKFKQYKITSLLWTLGSIAALICAPAMFMIISNFAAMQSLVFVVSILAVLFLFRWSSALLMITFGLYITLYSMQSYFVIDQGFQIQAILGITLLGTILAAFAGPKEKAYAVQAKRYAKLDDDSKYMSEEIKNLSIMKQEFINNVSHEIRTPMHHIGAGAEALHKDWDRYTSDEIKEYASTIYQGYQNARQYIDNLLDFSHLSTNRSTLDFTQNDLIKIAQNALEEFRELHQENSDLQINFFALEDSLRVDCDGKKIKKVIASLLENAYLYAPQSPIEITLNKAQMSNGELKAQFTIRDFGIGIEQDELVHIFGAFVQSSKTKKISGGKGIGLALCEKIISLHGGYIWAENNPNQPGASFSFVIPIMEGI